MGASRFKLENGRAVWEKRKGQMIIDSHKVEKRSKGAMSGFKGIVPNMHFSAGKNPNARRVEMFRLVVGVALLLAMVFGTLALLYNITKGAKDYAETLVEKADAKENERKPSAEMVEIILTPEGN